MQSKNILIGATILLSLAALVVGVAISAARDKYTVKVSAAQSVAREHPVL